MKLKVPSTVLPFLALATIPLSACSGGGSPTAPAPADTTPPGLATVTPFYSTAAPLDAIISAQFDEPLDPSSVHPDTLQVTRDGAPIAGTVTLAVDDETITFVPASLLDRGVDYVATVAASVTDVAGNPLAHAVEWQFRSSHWNPAQQISPLGGGGTAYALVVDSKGVSTLAWLDPDPGAFGLVAQRFLPGLGWQTPELLASAPSGGEPHLAVDDLDEVLLVYLEHSVQTNEWQVTARMFLPGSGWQPGTALRATTDFVDQVDVALSPSGMGAVVWRENPQSLDVLFASEYVPGLGWNAAQALPNFSAGQGIGPAKNPNLPRVAVDDSGRAVAVWSEVTSCCFSGWSDVLGRYFPGSGWDACQQTGASGQALGLSAPTPATIALLPGGTTAISVNAGDSGDGVTARVHGARYDLETNTITPLSDLDSGLHYAFDARMSMDANGVVRVIWLEYGDPEPDYARVMWTSGVAGADFGPAEVATVLQIDSPLELSLAGAPNGSLTALFGSWNGHAYAARTLHFEPLSGWDELESIDTSSDSLTIFGALVAASNVAVEAVWQRAIVTNESYELRGARRE